MIKLEQLELVEVNIEGQKATLVFLDEHNGEIREVTFNKQKYDADTKKFVDNEEKAHQVEEWSQEYFGVSFDSLGQAVGDRKDVYCYDNFNSLFEVKQIAKFEEDMVGQILNVEVIEVEDNGNNVFIKFEYDGDTYASKMGYSTFIESKGEWFVNSAKRDKQYAKFEEKFGINIENKEELIGKTVMVEVKAWKFAGKTGTFAEVKPFPKKKK